MADQPTPNPTSEFAPEQKTAFALAGTVALPSPFPASGLIYLGIMPRPYKSDEDDTVDDRFFPPRSSRP